MNLSENTVSVLKNYSTINQNLLIKPGKVLTTMSAMKNIVSRAEVEENFPREMAIYDLNEFLGVLTLVNDAELEFNSESHLTVNGGNVKIKYFFSDPSILTTPPESFNPPECDVSFGVTGKTLSSILKASAVMQLPDIVIEGNTGASITATDLKNTTSNNYTEQLNSETTQTFKFHFKADNLKMIPGDYQVNASSTAQVSNWVGKEVSYWIALEQSSD